MCNVYQQAVPRLYIPEEDSKLKCLQKKIPIHHPSLVGAVIAAIATTAFGNG